MVAGTRLGYHRIFLLMAGLFFLGRWNGLKPFVDLQGDAAYVSSYAASSDSPESFTSDVLFNQPENFGYYVSVQVSIIRFLKGILGDIGTAYIVLLVPYILAQLAGFYVFGRVLFRNRFFAFLLAILSLLLVNTQSWDYWGVFYDPQPRMLFQAVFPWLLTLVILSLERRWLRWLVFVCLGLMIYLHPVSTPAVAFAIWFGYLVSKPAEVKWGRHLLDLALFGVIFLLCAIPFFMQYLGNRDIARSVQVDYNTGIAFYKEVFTTTFQLRKTQAMMILGAIASGLVPLAYLGTIAVVRYREGARTVKDDPGLAGGYPAHLLRFQRLGTAAGIPPAGSAGADPDHPRVPLLGSPAGGPHPLAYGDLVGRCF